MSTTSTTPVEGRTIARMIEDEWSRTRVLIAFVSQLRASDRYRYLIGAPSTGISRVVRMTPWVYPMGALGIFGNDETKNDPPPRIDPLPRVNPRTPVDYSDLPELEDGDALALD